IRCHKNCLDWNLPLERRTRILQQDFGRRYNLFLLKVASLILFSSATIAFQEVFFLSKLHGLFDFIPFKLIYVNLSDENATLNKFASACDELCCVFLIFLLRPYCLIVHIMATIAMTAVKNVLTIIFDALPDILLNIVSVTIVSTLSLSGAVPTEPLTWNLIKVWLPVNIIFVGMLITSMFSCERFSVSHSTHQLTTSTHLPPFLFLVFSVRHSATRSFFFRSHALWVIAGLRGIHTLTG
ncbi:hypothetical protein ACJX0J_014254, partial [Zea mays]